MTNHADHDLCHIMPQGRRSESHVNMLCMLVKISLTSQPVSCWTKGWCGFDAQSLSFSSFSNQRRHTYSPRVEATRGNVRILVLPSSRVASSHRISVENSPFNLLSMPHRPSFGSSALRVAASGNQLKTNENRPVWRSSVSLCPLPPFRPIHPVVLLSACARAR